MGLKRLPRQGLILIRSFEELLPVMRCPASGQPLILENDASLITLDGSRRYPVLDGVPVLFAAGRSLFTPDGLGRWGASGGSPSGVKAKLRTVARRMLDLPPTASLNVAADDNFRELGRLLLESELTASPRRVLVVGGGTAGAGIQPLLDDPRLSFVETDVFLGPRTRVVCDAHDLPFADESFAAVVCQAVLEHVLEPWRVVEEIWRVLEPDGLVYSEIPFMQQVHEGAFDFTRFTHLGHRRLWRRFDEIRSGAQGGPGMALVWSITYFLRALVPRPAWAAADRLASLGFFWLKYLDGWLVSRPGGIDAASGTFFLGRRRSTPLDDRTIVRGYRGGGPRLD